MRYASVCVVAAAALIAAGCGGGDEESSATKWADGLCSSITSWQNSLTSSADSLRSGNVSKDSIDGAVDDAKSATDDFVDDVKGLGKPDTDSGEKAKEEVDQLATDLEDGMNKIEDTVKDASGVSGVVDALSSVTTTLGTMAGQVSSTINELEQLDPKGELKDAFEQADSCDQLTK